jgi:hypothetical protein
MAPRLYLCQHSLELFERIEIRLQRAPSSKAPLNEHQQTIREHGSADTPSASTNSGPATFASETIA